MGKWWENGGFPWDFMGIYPLVMTNTAIEAMTIEIVYLPIKNGDVS